jgi:hypothetical protein
MNNVLTLDAVTDLQRKYANLRSFEYCGKLYDACELVARWLESNTATDPRATDAAHALVCQHLQEEENSAAFDRADRAAEWPADES